MISTYPGFNYKSDELQKFLASSDIFTILLTNGEIIHFTPKNRTTFYVWLIEHQIEDIKFDNGNGTINK